MLWIAHTVTDFCTYPSQELYMRPKPGIILVINNVYVPPEIDQLIAWIIVERLYHI